MVHKHQTHADNRFKFTASKQAKFTVCYEQCVAISSFFTL